MADTTDPLVITLSGAVAIRTGPDRSFVDKGPSAIIIAIGLIAAAMGRSFGNQMVVDISGPVLDRPVVRPQEAGAAPTNLLAVLVTLRRILIVV